MSGKIDRRTTLAWVTAAAASPWMQDAMAQNAIAQDAAQPDAAQPGTWPNMELPPVTARGYGSDPNLVDPTVPWPLTLSPAQRAMLKSIAGAMLPGDDRSPSAASLAIDAFIDEWVSAPYPQQQADRALILPGLAWLDAECKARFGHDFAAAGEEQRRAVFDDIAWRGREKQGYQTPARFFARLRGLMMAGFYSLPEGMKDIGYIGNAPSTEWPGPPREALAHLDAGLEKLGLRPVR
jgi:hypothetical protein